MTNFKETFSGRHAILPVIHVETQDQTLRNAEIAINAGCDGVFLISMWGADHKALLQMHQVVHAKFPGWWIGVNFLDLQAKQVFGKLKAGVSGVWVDNAQINEHLIRQIEAEEIALARVNSGWEGLYFGGVAFKHQKKASNPALVAKKAVPYMDVITTSGEKTGSPPEVAKIEAMKGAIGNFPLAIASGISPENVKDYLDICDCFLTATSLLIPGTESLNPNRVKALVENVRWHE